jgi:hypothetical protein
VVIRFDRRLVGRDRNKVQALRKTGAPFSFLRIVCLEHDPEKWVPVFRKDHAQIKEIEWDDDSKKVIPL